VPRLGANAPEWVEQSLSRAVAKRMGAEVQHTDRYFNVSGTIDISRRFHHIIK